MNSNSFEYERLSRGIFWLAQLHLSDKTNIFHSARVWVDSLSISNQKSIDQYYWALLQMKTQSRHCSFQRLKFHPWPIILESDHHNNIRSRLLFPFEYLVFLLHHAPLLFLKE